MRLRIWTTLLLVTTAQFAWGQTSTNPKLVREETTSPGPSIDSYAVLGATSEQEVLVRNQIRIMHPDVYPLRVLFVPHWKYVDTARIFRLHVPAGYTSAMFTHLPSRSVFIDRDRYASDDSLGYWVAHELGHLSANSSSESDATKAARNYRKRLKVARKRAVHCGSTDRALGVLVTRKDLYQGLALGNRMAKRSSRANAMSLSRWFRSPRYFLAPFLASEE